MALASALLSAALSREDALKVEHRLNTIKLSREEACEIAHVLHRQNRATKTLSFLFAIYCQFPKLNVAAAFFALHASGGATELQKVIGWSNSAPLNSLRRPMPGQNRAVGV